MSRYLNTLKKVAIARSFSTSSAVKASVIPSNVLNSVEQSWKQMSVAEREDLTDKLQELQKQDWSKLTIEEKRAAYYVAFGAHGPREPLPKTGLQVAVGTFIVIGVAFGSFALIRSFAPPPPHTLTKEWQEATNELMKKQKANPISGYTSEGYKGKGWVDSE